MSTVTIDTGDAVRHGPTGEEWLVARVEGNRLSWCGWPPGGWTELADCTLVRKATQESRAKLLEDLAAGDGPHAAWAKSVLAPTAPSAEKPQQAVVLTTCPFCGGLPCLTERDVEPQGDSWYGKKLETFVLCDCGACLFDGAFHEGFYDPQTRAVEAWNRRAEPRSLSDAVLDRILDTPVADGETVFWSIVFGLNRDGDQVRRIMAREIVRTVLSAASQQEPPCA